MNNTTQQGKGSIPSTEGGGGDMIATYNAISNKSECLPDTYKVGRQAVFKFANIDLQDYINSLDSNSRGQWTYRIRSETRRVTNTDLTAFFIAAAQILYNQSYLTGHTNTNSGINALLSRQSPGEYKGEIVASLNDLCRAGYGVSDPTTDQRKAMETLIRLLHNCPVIGKNSKGESGGAYLATISTWIDTKDRGRVYMLHLNPLFTRAAATSFGLLQQGYTQQLRLAISEGGGKYTDTAARLALLLSIQDHRKPFARSMQDLVRFLRIESIRQKDRARAEAQVLQACKAVQAAGLIDGYKAEYTGDGRRKHITKITFVFGAERAENERL